MFPMVVFVLPLEVQSSAVPKVKGAFPASILESPRRLNASLSDSYLPVLVLCLRG